MPYHKKSLAELMGKLSSVLYNDMVHIKVSSIIGCGKIIVVIPKKIGSAPVRNRSRRRLSEIFRQAPNLQHYNIVVFVKKRLDTVPHETLKQFFAELTTLLLHKKQKSS